jgi:hypothetical protein
MSELSLGASTVEINRDRNKLFDLPKISGLDRFLDLDQDFWDWKVVSRQNPDFSILIKTSRLSRQVF